MSTRTTTARLALAAGMLAPAALVAAVTPAGAHGEDQQERFLYVSTIAQSETDPDFVAVIGADPEQPDFGEIVNRVDMPNVGDELHHFGYSADQQRLIVPGLFSNRIHVFDVGSDGSTMTLSAVNEDLVADSGYAVPHGVMAMHDMVLAPMIGAANDETQPGGIVEIDDRTGEFVDYFGPGPERDASDSGPTYMYDFAMTPDGERAISTTFGSPAQCAPGIDPTCLGDEVAVWDVHAEEVIDTDKPRYEQRRADGPVRRPTRGAAGVHQRTRHERRVARRRRRRRRRVRLPAGARPRRRPRASHRHGRVIRQHVPLRVELVRQHRAAVRHQRPVPPDAPVHRRGATPQHAAPQPDNSRLYVTNSLLTPWDNDADFGEPRNSDYGIWLFDVDTSGDLTPLHADGSAWVSFDNVEKLTTTGPAGPHMMLFDPSIPLEPGEH